MYKGTNPGSKRVYTGFKATTGSGIRTHHTNQKDVKSRRNPAAKNLFVSNKPNSKDYRDFEKEEDKYEDVLATPFKRMQLADISTHDLEALRNRIEYLEQQNKQKDSIINKLKAENGQLRSQRNIMQGKLNNYKSEEAKEKRNGPSKAESSLSNRPPWNASSKKMTGKSLFRAFLMAL
jgi:predicted RNase H-like nuclease (RuvC/YqgF family)